MNKSNTDTDNSGDWNSGNLNSGDWNSGNLNSGNLNSGDRNSGNLNSGDRNSGDLNSGDLNSGDRNSGDLNSGDLNSGNLNSGDWNSGDRNSGDWNSGDWNSGDWNSGICNTDEPKMRAFNKPCNFTYTEFRNKWGHKDVNLQITAWIDKEDMTDEEKEEIDGWETMGGYLKTCVSYKDAWRIAWSKATQEQKDWYMSFPNFDADIWFEITGIDVRENTKKDELLKKANELIEKANELKKEAENL